MSDRSVSIVTSHKLTATRLYAFRRLQRTMMMMVVMAKNDRPYEQTTEHPVLVAHTILYSKSLLHSEV